MTEILDDTAWDISQFDASDSHACALHVNGTPACFTAPSFSHKLYPTPAKTPLPWISAPLSREGFEQVCAGSMFTCGISKWDASVSCWGAQDHAAVVSWPPMRRGGYVGLSCGENFACSVPKGGGEAVCWGEDLQSQVSGVPHAKLRSVSAGGIHACGLVLETSAFDALGSKVVCWGAKDALEGQASPPKGLRFSQVSAGTWHTCGLLTGASGEIVCWGGGSHNQAVPPRGMAFVSVRAGRSTTCAIEQRTGAVICWGKDRADVHPSRKGNLIVQSRLASQPLHQWPLCRGSDSMVEIHRVGVALDVADPRAKVLGRDIIILPPSSIPHNYCSLLLSHTSLAVSDTQKTVSVLVSAFHLPANWTLLFVASGWGYAEVRDGVPIGVYKHKKENLTVSVAVPRIAGVHRLRIFAASHSGEGQVSSLDCLGGFLLLVVTAPGAQQGAISSQIGLIRAGVGESNIGRVIKLDVLGGLRGIGVLLTWNHEETGRYYPNRIEDLTSKNGGAWEGGIIKSRQKGAAKFDGGCWVQTGACKGDDDEDGGLCVVVEGQGRDGLSIGLISEMGDLLDDLVPSVEYDGDDSDACPTSNVIKCNDSLTLTDQKVDVTALNVESEGLCSHCWHTLDDPGLCETGLFPADEGMCWSRQYTWLPAWPRREGNDECLKCLDGVESGIMLEAEGEVRWGRRNVDGLRCEGWGLDVAIDSRSEGIRIGGFVYVLTSGDDPYCRPLRKHVLSIITSTAAALISRNDLIVIVSGPHAEPFLMWLKNQKGIIGVRTGSHAEDGKVSTHRMELSGILMEACHSTTLDVVWVKLVGLPGEHDRNFSGISLDQPCGCIAALVVGGCHMCVPFESGDDGEWWGTCEHVRELETLEDPREDRIPEMFVGGIGAWPWSSWDSRTMSLFNSMAIEAQTTVESVANLNLESMRMYTPSCQIDGEEEEEEDFIVVSPSYSEVINGNQILVVVKAKAALVKSAGGVIRASIHPYGLPWKARRLQTDTVWEEISPPDGPYSRRKTMLLNLDGSDGDIRILLAIGRRSRIAVLRVVLINPKYIYERREALQKLEPLLLSPTSVGQEWDISSWHCNTTTLTTICDIHYAVYQRTRTAGYVALSSSSLPPSFRPNHGMRNGRFDHARLRFRPESQVSVDRCDAYVHTDAYLFGFTNPNHFGHVFFDTFFPLFKTVAMFSGEAVFEGEGLVMLVTDLADAGGQGSYHHEILHGVAGFRWYSFSDLRNAGSRVCFRRLVAGLTDKLSFYSTQETLYRDPQSAPLALPRDRTRVRKLVFTSLFPEWVEAHVEGIAAAIIYRDKKSANNRILYRVEQLLEVLKGLREGTEAFTIDFAFMTLRHQVMAMQEVNILVGVVGTGLVNSLWMPPGGVGIQLFPFGTMDVTGKEFQSCIETGPQNYLRWESKRVYGSIFRYRNGTGCFAPVGCAPSDLFPPNSDIPYEALANPSAYWESHWAESFSLYYLQSPVVVDLEEFQELSGRAAEIIDAWAGRNENLQ